MSKQQAIDNAVLRRVERNRAKKEAFMSNSFVNGNNVAIPRVSGRDPIEAGDAMSDVIKIGNTFMKGTQKDPSSDSINSGFNVSSVIPVSVKSVDGKDVNAQFGFGRASHPGDTRANPGDTAAASLAQASGSNKGPRDPVGQFRNSKNDHGGDFQQTIDTTTVGG
jgi:hypothetical protein